MNEQHLAKNATATLALKPMQNFDRYGAVECDEDSRITSFLEKQFCEQGAINGGVYLLQTNLFERLNLPDQFSMEEGFFNAYCSEKSFYGFVSDGYFIDIGIPEDYQKAQGEL